MYSPLSLLTLLKAFVLGLCAQLLPPQQLCVLHRGYDQTRLSRGRLLDFMYRTPQALQRVFGPSGPPRHSGVLVVPQLRHVWTQPCLDALHGKVVLLRGLMAAPTWRILCWFADECLVTEPCRLVTEPCPRGTAQLLSCTALTLGVPKDVSPN